jgi:hypothetical protein
MNITKEITIEELIEKVPESVKYLMEEGIRCVVCGEPIWGTLEEAVLEKGFKKGDLIRFIKELNEIASNSKGQQKDSTQINIDKLDA